MSTQLVSIARAKSATPCLLWDNRRAMPGVPIKVTVSQAADLLMREPDEWTLPTASELALVNSEIKVRTAPPAAAEGKE